MDPTITDYQGACLYGNQPNTSAIDATMLNPSASGPSDWTSVLTNGISAAAVNGINGAINNTIQAGAIQNEITAINGGVVTTPSGTLMVGGSMMPLIICAAVIFLVLK